MRREWECLGVRSAEESIQEPYVLATHSSEGHKVYLVSEANQSRSTKGWSTPRLKQILNHCMMIVNRKGALKHLDSI